jgi:uncharacterized protein YerC
MIRFMKLKDTTNQSRATISQARRGRRGGEGATEIVVSNVQSPAKK